MTGSGNRLAPPNAVKVIKNLKRASGRAELSYMEIKEASQYVERYKIEAKAAMKAWRSWNTRAAVSELVGALRMQEGRILRSDAVAKASLYLDAQRGLSRSGKAGHGASLPSRQRSGRAL